MRTDWEHGKNLLVVLGAGASWDPLPFPADMSPDIHRPPMTQGLAEPTRVGRSLSKRYRDVQPLLDFLQARLKNKAEGASEPQTLEDALATYLTVKGANTKYHVLAMRFYLRDLLWDATQSVLRANGEITNYTHLVRHCYEWAEKRDLHACVVSFNYDTLLESACVSHFGRQGFSPADLSSYVSDQFMSVLKPHGSVLWAWKYPDDSVTAYTDANDIIGLGEPEFGFEQEPEALRSPEDNFVTVEMTTTFQDGIRKEFVQRPAVPALALPVTNKAALVWPNQQDRFFREGIHNGSFGRVLVVGWRAAEAHFKALLRRLVIPQAQFLVVTGSDADAWETEQRLRTCSTQEFARITGSSAFGKLVEESRLSDWLPS